MEVCGGDASDGGGEGQRERQRRGVELRSGHAQGRRKCRLARCTHAATVDAQLALVCVHQVVVAQGVVLGAQRRVGDGAVSVVPLAVSAHGDAVLHATSVVGVHAQPVRVAAEGGAIRPHEGTLSALVVAAKPALGGRVFRVAQRAQLGVLSCG